MFSALEAQSCSVEKDLGTVGKQELAVAQILALALVLILVAVATLFGIVCKTKHELPGGGSRLGGGSNELKVRRERTFSRRGIKLVCVQEFK